MNIKRYIAFAIISYPFYCSTMAFSKIAHELIINDKHDIYIYHEGAVGWHKVYTSPRTLKSPVHRVNDNTLIAYQGPDDSRVIIHVIMVRAGTVRSSSIIWSSIILSMGEKTAA